MRYIVLTVVTLLLAGPVAMGQPAAKEAASVTWQFYAGKTPHGEPIPPSGTKVNLRCAIISSDEDGAWVCLYVNAIPKSKLPDNKNADACRPLGKDGANFKLTNPALLPDSDTTQLVAFVSNATETMYKLVVKTDGSISIEIVGPTFAGETSMSGAASVCWYVTKKK